MNQIYYQFDSYYISEMIKNLVITLKHEFVLNW